MPTPAPSTINDAGVSLVKRFEGLGDGDPKTVNLDPYLCPAGVWTIGWGHALKQGKGLLRGATFASAAKAMYPNGITKDEAEALLRADLLNAAADVRRWVATYATPLDPFFMLSSNQFSALGSWFFNLGYKDETVNSTLLKKVKRRDWPGAASEFAKWRISAGRVEKGLVYRRACEALLFLAPDGETPDFDAELKRLRSAR